ncbi:MAG: hypothetical protein R2939_11470 [Kofleriaceae bacterium]
MLTELGSLRICERAPERLVLGLGRLTRVAGWALAGAAASAALWLLPYSLTLAALAGCVAGVGLLLASARREIVIDHHDGVVRVHQGVAGLSSRSVTPLFHLRAVVLTRRGAGFVLQLERRLGGRIAIDDGGRVGPLRALARAIAEVGELRFVDDTAAAA